MNRLLICLLSCMIVTSIGCNSVSTKFAGQDAPPARLFKLEDGSPVFLEEYKGKTLVVSFWATTCTSSNPVMKRLARYAERFAHDTRVAFVAVSLDKLEHVDRLKERIKYEDFTSMEHMCSGNEEYDEVFNALGGERMPYIVVIDQFGKIVATDTDDGFVSDLIKPGKPMPIASVNRKR